MKLINVFIFSLAFGVSYGQSTDLVTQAELAMHLRYLSSDELEGRKTGEQGNLVAARYIAELYRLAGLKSFDEEGTYFQNIDFEKSSPASEGSVMIDSLDLEHGTDALILRGGNVVDGELVFANFAWQDDEHDDFKDLDVEGKYVLALLGTPEGEGVQEAFAKVRQKRKILHDLGAKGLVEIYKGEYPWNYLRGFLNSEQLIVREDGEQDDPNFSYVMLGPEIDFNAEDFPMGKTMRMSIHEEGLQRNVVQSPNIIGYIEGSDSTLREEYVVVSAHFDHVGIGSKPGTTDSIHNGARDNAIGTSALLMTAFELAAHSPKRSVIFAAFTAEEIGLLGSEYFIDHAPVPLKQIIFNLNCDGGGYHDTTIVSVMGLNRVGAEVEMTQAAAEYDLGIFADPAPEQNLFDRSDNVNFAAVGIPAPTFSPGIKEFNQEILKYYHQPIDEFESLDMNYVYRFCQAFRLAAELIANKDERPRWSEGDKYEEAFKKLYGRKE